MLQRLHTLRPEPRGCGGRLDLDKSQRSRRENSCETCGSVMQRTSASLPTGSTKTRHFPSNTVYKSHLINILTQPQLCCCLESHAWKPGSILRVHAVNQGIDIPARQRNTTIPTARSFIGSRAKSATSRPRVVLCEMQVI